MVDTTNPLPPSAAKSEPGFVRAIGLFDGTMIVVGSMIGSGIFIVAADISRQTGSPGGLLLTWVLTGLLTVSAALSYGELAAMFPHAGGQYIYLREAYSPLWGFLYGWTLFLVIQTGTIAAVAVGFARYLGVLFPAISPNTWVVAPIALGSKLAISLSVQQLVGVLMIFLLTFLNTQGVRLGKLIQLHRRDARANHRAHLLQRAPDDQTRSMHLFELGRRFTDNHQRPSARFTISPSARLTSSTLTEASTSSRTPCSR